MKMRRVLVGAAGVAWMVLAASAGADINGHFGLHLNNGFGGGGWGGGWGGGCGPGGLNISGSYRGSRWSVDYNLGSGWAGGSGSGWAIGGPPGWGIYGTRGDGWYVNHGWGGPYRGWGWYYDRYQPYGYASGPVESRSGPVDWSLLPGVNPQNPQGSAADLPKAPPTTLELAHEASAARKHEEAAGLLREHLKTAPEDVEAMRGLAVCLIEGKESGAGLAMLRDLYTKDPTLAERAFDGSVMGVDASRLRELVVKVSPIANKVKSPSAWLAIVVMMQAEGRKAEALRAVQKAKDAGLERAVVDRFVAALTPPPPAAKPTPVVKPVTAAKPVKPAVKPKTPAGPPKPGPTEPGPDEGKPKADPSEAAK